MKQIIIESKKYGQKVVQVDDEDYDELIKYNWFADPHDNTFYAIRKIKRVNGKQKKIYMHRQLLWLTDPKIKGEHIDHNGLNNQRSNLRVATQAQNCANKRAKKNGTSKYLGVHWSERDKRFIVQIRKNNKGMLIGHFKDEIEAAQAYNLKAIELHGEFANLNKIDLVRHTFGYINA